ncbi:hypothetical protein KY317_01480 [Candidatus Woesearchaeota archaeon]|nr:hypothetical protein [Candidatus Woesearchaeota archaeon]
MRKIEGYVCVGIVKDAIEREFYFLFGKNTGKGSGHCSNISLNDLTPYETKERAKKGLNDLNARGHFESVKLAQLKMNISGTAEEFDEFEGLDKIIVVAYHDEFNEQWLMGPFVKGMPSHAPVPGADLSYNGLKTFDSLKSAKYLCREVNRQMQMPARIASFELEYL